MEQLETLKRKIESAGDLHSVVKTMKALAAVNIREYERAVESLSRYSRAVEMGLQIAMKNRPREKVISRPREEDSLGAVIFGSDQGMVGQFNDHIASYALERMKEFGIPPQKRSLLVLGERVISRLEEAGHPVEDSVPMFGSLVDINSIMQEVLIKIEDWRLKREVKRIVLFYNRPTQGAAYEPHMKYLLPLDLNWLQSLENKEWPTRVLPTFTMKWRVLFSSLIRHYFFVSVYRASVESLASENASRLASMQAAEKNIQERMEDLNTRFQHQRQESITAELLDIVSGFEIISQER
ncbi:MAG: F0F1 ATP synthase subunit gamma [Candidatus Aminicenantes bacterium]